MPRFLTLLTLLLAAVCFPLAAPLAHAQTCTGASDVVQADADATLPLAGLPLDNDLGQSFVAPCSGFLRGFRFHVATVTSPVSGTLRVFTGDGAIALNEVISARTPFSITAPGPHDISLAVSAPVVSGVSYTVLLDASAGNAALDYQGASDAYAGGSLKYGSGGTLTLTGADLAFTADLDEAALPVELASFTVTADAGVARLRWETASEVNNAGFHVEQRGSAAGAWREVAYAAGRGTTAERTTYSQSVFGLTPGIYTFRLRQVDLDGATNYSPTVEVSIGLEGAATLEVRGTSVRFVVREQQAVRAELFNVMGQRMAVLFDDEAAAGQTQVLSVPLGLSAGVYLVRVSGRSFAETARVLVR